MKKIESFIKKYLENRPAFHAFIRPQEAMLFQRYQKYIKSPVLDFGCGDGFFAQTVFGKGTIDVGLDMAYSRANDAENEKIYKKVVYYDGKTIPYPDNYFQSVISNCVLEHIVNLNQSLKEIYRILKPGGYFLTTVMTDKWEDYLLGAKIFGNFYKNFMRKMQQHQSLSTASQWINQFRKHGFKIIKTVGYLSQKNSHLNEVFHYLSFSSLISYKLSKKWILIPRLSSFWKNIVQKNPVPVHLSQSAAIFIILKKN